MVILCIDDDMDDLELLTEAIITIDPSYTCISALNGRLALDMLKDLQPDFVFLDINMPILNGKATLKEIRKDNRLARTPVCILSTSILSKEREMYIKMGANHCLVKPNTFEELCTSIKTILIPSRILLKKKVMQKN